MCFNFEIRNSYVFYRKYEKVLSLFVSDRVVHKSHLLNGEAELPCDVSTSKGDSVTLAVWYKRKENTDNGLFTIVR